MPPRYACQCGEAIGAAQRSNPALSHLARAATWGDRLWRGEPLGRLSALPKKKPGVFANTGLHTNTIDFTIGSRLLQTLRKAPQASFRE